MPAPGEAYREGLEAMAEHLGVAGHVVFLDQFVDKATLLEHISMCDVYVTPYLNEAQMTSGTLAYSYGMGKAVVSSPYWHAAELLAGGRGILVPFGDTQSMGDEISDLLSDEPRRLEIRCRAYEDSRAFVWARTAEQYLTTMECARITYRRRPKVTPIALAHSQANPQRLVIDTSHLLAMCDDVGMLQHARHCVADRNHGYCIDDNARALLLSCTLAACGEPTLPDALTSRFASFIQHAWNPDAGRFRNFMGYDRRWLEDVGSEDSHARTLWALGVCALSDPHPSRRNWAGDLFVEALAATDSFVSPRAWAFSLLGLDKYLQAAPDDWDAAECRRRLADRLIARLSLSETPDWPWFEDSLAYDNARMSEALIVSGLATDGLAWIDAGLRTLTWLTDKQTAADGHFRPIGTDSFNTHQVSTSRFDQQPLEAASGVSAFRAAWKADGDPRWTTAASGAFNWFLGRNDLGVYIADLENGGCRDGLHPDRANENRGAESTLAYLMAHTEIRQFAREHVIQRGAPPSLALSA